jgi:hypothetical protein
MIFGSTTFTSVQGHQSDAIVTTNLTGNFNPSSIGSDANAWDNLVSSGKNLRRFNGITHNNSAPHNFQFDGTNDFLGAAETGYGGDPFHMNTGADFTLAQWYKHVNNAKHIAFSITYSGSDILFLSTGHRVANKMTLENEGGTRLEFPNYTFSNNTWYYIALVCTAVGDMSVPNTYRFFVNGSFVDDGSLAVNGTAGSDVQIGKTAGSTYTAANIKVGHVHVYNAALKNSHIRQNFLATHEINSDRIYGATYTA